MKIVYMFHPVGEKLVVGEGGSFQIWGQLRGLERQNVKGQPPKKMEFGKVSSTYKLFSLPEFAVHALEACDCKMQLL